MCTPLTMFTRYVIIHLFSSRLVIGMVECILMYASVSVYLSTYLLICQLADWSQNVGCKVLSSLHAAALLHS